MTARDALETLISHHNCQTVKELAIHADWTYSDGATINVYEFKLEDGKYLFFADDAWEPAIDDSIESYINSWSDDGWLIALGLAQEESPEPADLENLEESAKVKIYAKYSFGSVTNNNKDGFVQNAQGEEIEFTKAEALDFIENEDNSVYHLCHGEVSRRELIVVDARSGDEAAQSSVSKLEGLSVSKQQKWKLKTGFESSDYRKGYRAGYRAEKLNSASRIEGKSENYCRGYQSGRKAADRKKAGF